MPNKDENINRHKEQIEAVVEQWGYHRGSIPFKEFVLKTEKWLSNFEIDEIDIMVSLLDKIQYQSEKEIKVLISQICNDLKSKFGTNLKDVLFFTLGNSSASSGTQFLYDFQKELSLTEYNFRQDSYKSYLDKDINIVFIDDLIASGSQASKFYNQNLIDVKAQCHYHALFGYEEGIEYISQNAKFDTLFVAQTLTKKDKAFSGNSTLFTDISQRNQIKKIAKKYGKKLYPKNRHGEHPLGFGNMQSLIVFEHNTPNNTLPIIWASNNNEKQNGYHWYPLFERRKIYTKVSPKLPSKIDIKEEEKKFIDNIFDFMEQAIIVALHQNKTQIAHLVREIYRRAKNRYPNHFYHLIIPSNVTRESFYIALSKTFDTPITNSAEFEIVVQNISKHNKMLFYIENFEAMKEEIEIAKEISRAMTNLKNSFLYEIDIILIGQETLAQMTYDGGALSPLNNAQKLIFPNNATIEYDSVKNFWTKLDPSYQNWLFSHIEREAIGSFTLSEKKTSLAFWNNIVTKRGDKLYWKDESVREYIKEIVDEVE